MNTTLQEKIKSVDENYHEKYIKLENDREREIIGLRNEEARNHMQRLDKLFEDNIISMLKISDFVYTGSNKQEKQTDNFNNCYFPTVLKKMVSEKKLKFIKFDKSGPQPSVFYYNNLSDEQVNNMDKKEIERRTFRFEN
jgi:hypothetical protein